MALTKEEIGSILEGEERVMRERKPASCGIIIAVIACLATTVSGCGASDETKAIATNTSTSAAASTPIETAVPTSPPQPSVNYATHIRLSSPGKFGGQMFLEVLIGRYQLARGGDIALAGSSMDVSEDMLTFPSGVLVEIGTGGVTLGGKTYSDGTKLAADSSGGLSVVNG